MKVYYNILAILILLLQVSAGPVESDQDEKQLKLYLTMDRENYSSSEEITIHISVRNISGKLAEFEIYEDSQPETPDFTTFQPIVFDLKGREAENIIPYRMENRTTADVIKSLKKRKITIGANETFTHDINIKKVYNLKEGHYRVKSYFIPNFSERYILYSENELSFHITAEDSGTFKKEIGGDDSTITPGEIVLLCLDAEKRKQWQKMLKYLNEQEYIYSFHRFVRPYNKAGPRERSEILISFRRFLARHRHDYIVNFNITREDLEPDKKFARVDAVVERYGPRKNEMFRYMYRLERRKNYWVINAVEATVLKGSVK